MAIKKITIIDRRGEERTCQNFIVVDDDDFHFFSEAESNLSSFTFNAQQKS
jgi:hypothetical protein